MANGFNRFMNFLKLTDEDAEFDDDFYDDEYDYDDQKELEREERRIQKEQKREEKRSTSRRSSDSYYEAEEPAPVPKRTNSFRASAGSNKVVQMPSSGKDMEVCIIKPNNIGEAQQACSLLMGNHPVVVNLEGIDTLEAQRIMDFICGCIFAVSGNMCQISRFIFIFSPKDVDISGDYVKGLENEESFHIASFDKGF